MRYITAIIFASLATGLIVMYVYPTYERIEEEKQKKKELVEFLAKAEEAQAKIDELERKKLSLPVDAESRMNAMIPESIDDVKFSMELTELAKSHGLSLANPSIRSLASDKASKMKEYSVSFQVDSPYNTFVRFLGDLEYSLHIRDITSLTMAVGENTAAPMKISVEFTTYALR